MESNTRYELSERGGSSYFLCHSVNGFESLWEDYIKGRGIVGNALSTSLECILEEEFKLGESDSESISSELRGSILNLLPCAFTVEELHLFILNYLKR